MGWQRGKDNDPRRVSRAKTKFWRTLGYAMLIHHGEHEEALAELRALEIDPEEMLEEVRRSRRARAPATHTP